MSEPLRAALTETRNAFEGMPAAVEGLGALAGRLEQVRAANVAHHQVLARRAARAGARLVCFGELFTGPYFALGADELWFGLAEDAREGPTVAALRETAAHLGLVVVAPLYERAGDGRRFNTAVVIDADGSWLGRYRKVHIPAGRNERAAFCETFYYEGSDGALDNTAADVSSNPFFPVFETAVGRVGVAICYDRHFEGVVRSLARAGAEVVLSPAVTFGAHSRRLWDLEFAVDAARHGVFLGGSNRRGAEPPWGVEYFGASGFWGPDGRVEPLGPSAAPDAGDELVLADLDLSSLFGAGGSGWDLERDARPEAYSD
ncbi:MAG: nitrilase-related carbon-nitrogen hydrolase [Planctomycetota bacterium]|jgi:N-carbamoylputrescine amidase|nr:nitrilase-related carbon-nitrogen hydrolase [Planctomycetota bacterium]MDP6762339.1 nitrilase-related carbon-nitrogen hydrolase [Planctomycetota bacterium]MDP6989736.1 nitrilase-related carbon-nitrogen hydrolase [Planctomycetota bacterium]